MIDKFGLCPNCKLNWNRGDIFEALRDLDVFLHADDDAVKKVANQYGWTAEKPTNFSKTITHQIQGTSYIVCPAFSCGHVFNPATDEEFKSLWALHKELEEFIPPEIAVQMNSEGVLETTVVIIEEEEEEEESPFHEDTVQPLMEQMSEQVQKYTEVIIKMEEQIHKELGIPQERLGQPQTTNYGKNTTGSFSKLSEILRQGKRKAD